MKSITNIRIVLVFAIFALSNCISNTFMSLQKDNILDFSTQIEDFMANYKMNKDDNVSFSQADGVVQKRIDFDVEIDMEKKIIDGFVRIYYKCLKPTNFMGLDVRGLKINKVTDFDEKPLNFYIHKNTKNSIGDALIIKFNENCKGDSYLQIYYTTDPKSLGVHFSDPAVMHDKKYSFLTTHGEAIYGRSFFPSQDTPSLKITTGARIRIKEPYTVLFSGEFINKKTVENGLVEYSFVLDKPIPTYLITFAAGVVVKKEIPNSRCEVWGEKDALKWVDESFEFCEQYIKFYETYKPFVFKRMVFLIVPDDFPFSGMENPYVTYISEAVLSKDRSYTATIAHEIVHFWSGNLVTNKNWSSFWLNEGITTYLNRKAFRVIHGEEVFFFELYSGLFKLKTALKDLKKNKIFDITARSLTPKITDDPYISFSRVPYEKGSFFMYHLETVLGDKVLHNIMSDYFNEFQFKSLDADTFIKFLKAGIMEYHKEGGKIIKGINWNEWLNGTEMIPVDMHITSKHVEEFKKTIEVFKKGEKSLDELKTLFTSMKVAEKDRVIKELTEEFEKLPEAGKTLIKQLLDNESLFNEHIILIASRIILQANFIADKTERQNHLLNSLETVIFYKVLHLRKVFSLLREINPDKKFLSDIIVKYEKRFNPLAVARLKEYLELS